MKKFLLALTLIIALLIGGGVYFMSKTLNSDSYIKQIVQTVFDLTGRRLEIKGNTSLKWRPLPTLEMTDVIFSNQEGSIEPTMAMAQRVLVEIEWSSLLKTPLVIKNIEIVRPSILLERLDTDLNEANWNFNFLFAPDTNLEQGPLTTNSALDTRIERVRIVEGNISYINRRTATFLRMIDINGDLSIDSLKGPFRFTGEGVFNKVLFKLKTNFEAFKVSTPTNFSVFAQEVKSASELTFNGTVYPDGSASLMSGDASFSIQKPAVFFEQFGAVKSTESTFNKPSVGNFSIDTTPTENILKNMTIRFGETEKDTAIIISVTQRFIKNEPIDINLTLALNKLNFEDWKPYLNQPNYWDLIDPALTGTSRITAQINIEDLILPTGTIKNSAAKMFYADGELTIEDIQTTFPDNAPVHIVGFGEADNGIPKLQLTVNAKFADMLPTLNLLGLKPQNANTDLYKNATLETRLILTATEIGGAIKTLTFDSSAVSGIFAFPFDNTKEVAVVAMLQNVNLDTYLNWKPSSEKTNLSQVPQMLQTELSRLTDLSTIVSRFDLNFKDLTFKNMPIISGRVLGGLVDGVLRIDSLALRNMASADLNMTGVISGIGKSNLLLDNVNVDFSAKQLPLFLNRANIKSDLPLFSQAEKTSVRGSISGTPERWALNMTTGLSDTNARFNGEIRSQNNELIFKDMNFDIANPDFIGFMKSLNLNPKDLPNLEGNLKAKGILNGSADNFNLTDLSVGVGIQNMTGRFILTQKPEKSITLDLNTTALNVDRILPQSAGLYKNGQLSLDAFNFDALNGWKIDLKLASDQLTYKTLSLFKTNLIANIRDRQLNIKDFSGESRSTTTAPFNLKGLYDWGTTPTLKATLSLKNSPLRADFMVLDKMAFGLGNVSVDVSVNGQGNSLTDLINSLNGQGRLTFKDNQLIGVDFAQTAQVLISALKNQVQKPVLENQLGRALTSGKTMITELSGDMSISNGVVRLMDMTLQSPEGTSTGAQCILNIPDATLDMNIPVKLTALQNLPAFILTFTQNDRRMNYTYNATDLIDTVWGEINRSFTAAAEQKQLALDERKEMALKERDTRIRSTISAANDTYQKAQKNIINFPSERSKLLLQSAKDALSVVNQLSVKENLNEMQYTQLMEQAAIVELKAKEIQTDLEKDQHFDRRRTILTYTQQGEAYLDKMIEVRSRMPYIEIIPQLISQSQKNLGILHKTGTILSPTVTEQQASTIMTAATIALERIKESYDRIMQFDIAQNPTESGSVTRSSGIRGQITR